MISFIVRIYVEHLVDSEICQLNQKKIKHINQLNETYIFHKAEIRWYESQIDAAEITQKFEHCLCFHHPLIIPKVQFGHFLKFGKTTVPRLVISFSSLWPQLPHVKTIFHVIFYNFDFYFINVNTKISQLMNETNEKL